MSLIFVEEFELHMMTFYAGRLCSSCDNVQPFLLCANTAFPPDQLQS